MKVIKCDICGKETEFETPDARVEMRRADRLDIDSGVSMYRSADLCINCAIKLQEFLDKKPSEKSGKKPKKTSTEPQSAAGEKKEIDKGKIMALHKAGWSSLKIAEEMRLSSSYTCQLIREMMAEGEREGED